MFALYESEIGNIVIKSDGEFITELNFIEDDEIPNYTFSEDETIIACKKELDGYFSGTLKTFTTKVKHKTTTFRHEVYNELIKIPYGTTVSYSDIAKNINNPKAVRAVGSANHNNKISIIVPCHRVIGKDGKLVGYGGKLWRKQWLLEHEK